MPYIEKNARALVLTHGATTPGELNFHITTLIADYLGEQISYSQINEVIGVLECAKLELYRRVAAPYEDQKIEENGDVY